MKKAFAIAGLSLLKNRKDMLFVFIMIAAALFFTFVVGLIFGENKGQDNVDKISVLVADNDKSSLSSDIIQQLKDKDIYHIELINEQELYQKVRQGKAGVGYVIPEGFEASLSSDNPKDIKMISLSISNTGMAVSKVIEKTIYDYLAQDAIAEIIEEQAQSIGILHIDVDSAVSEFKQSVKNSPAMTVQVQYVKQKDVQQRQDNEGFSWAAMGMILQFTMFTVIFSSGGILEEKKNNTWSRLLTTPTSRWSILGGKIMGAYLLGVLQVVILIVAGNYLFGIDYGSNILAVAVVMAVFLFAVVGIGIFMSTIVTSPAQLNALAPIVIVSTCMLGGCFWPLDLVPPAMQNAAKFTPQAWTIQALQDVVVRGRGLSAVTYNLSIILAFGLVFFILGVSRVKYE